MRVLIAYDGSAGAEQSLRLADSIDWPADSTLRIASVIEPTLLLRGRPDGRRVRYPAARSRRRDHGVSTGTGHEGGREPPIRRPHGGRHRSARTAGNGARRRGDAIWCGSGDGRIAWSRDDLEASPGIGFGRGRRSRPMSRPRFAHPVDQIVSSSPRTAPLPLRPPRPCYPRGRSSSACRSTWSASPRWSSRGTPGSRPTMYRQVIEAHAQRPRRGQGRAHAHRRRDDRAASGARAASRSGHANGRRGRGDHRCRSRCGRRSRRDGLARSNRSCERRPWQRGPERVAWQPGFGPGGSRTQGSGSPQGPSDPCEVDGE